MADWRKDRKCVQCGATMTYEEWAKIVLHPHSTAWLRKKYCDDDCCKAYNNAKRKKR